MAMSRLLLLQFLLMLAVLTVWSKTRKPTFHYHRYLHSKYAAQHHPRTQKDYKPVIPVYPEVKPAPVFGRSEEPRIKIGSMGTTVPLHDLLVRIYNNGQYLCMGTLITERLIATSATCFSTAGIRDLTIKTDTNEVMPVIQKHSSEYFKIDKDTLLSVLELINPVGNSSITISETKLCDKPLLPSLAVQLTTYIRTRHTVHTQTTQVLPLSECRRLMNDPGGILVRDTMICVKNNRYSAKCQHTFGNPLIYDGMVCGINVMGHNCPRPFGVDVYDTVYNTATFMDERVKVVIKSDIENSIF